MSRDEIAARLVYLEGVAVRDKSVRWLLERADALAAALVTTSSLATLIAHGMTWEAAPQVKTEALATEQEALAALTAYRGTR